MVGYTVPSSSTRGATFEELVMNYYIQTKQYFIYFKILIYIYLIYLICLKISFNNLFSIVQMSHFDFLIKCKMYTQLKTTTFFNTWQELCLHIIYSRPLFVEQSPCAFTDLVSTNWETSANIFLLRVFGLFGPEYFSISMHG